MSRRSLFAFRASQIRQGKVVNLDSGRVSLLNPLSKHERHSVAAVDLSERLTNLEMTVAHLEHELGQMHSVLLAVQAELKESRDQIMKLERRLVLAGEPHEERDPQDERPPHY